RLGSEHNEVIHANSRGSGPYVKGISVSLLLSNSMLAAALLVGQAADAPPAVKTVTTSSVPAPPTLQPASVQSPSAGQPSAQPQRGPIMSWFSRDDRPVVSKIQTWFKREPAETPPQPMMKREVIRETAPPPLNNTPTPTPTSDFPRRMPSSSSKTPTPTNIIATEPPGAVTDVVLVSGSGTSIKTKTPISSEFATMIGHDEKFEWITGQLEIENGVFVLYYATPDTID